MTTMKTDPVFATLHARMKDCENKAKGCQSQINLLAEELTLVQRNKRLAENEAANLRSHLDANYPGWDSESSDDSEA